MKKTICFYNYWHNADCFAGKGWMLDIIRQYPDIEYISAHGNNVKLLLDMPAKHVHVSQIPQMPHHYIRAAVSTEAIFINTWCGAYKDEVFRPGELHANWLSLHRQFKIVANNINQYAGTNITFDKNLLEYVPETNWSYFDTVLADNFIDRFPNTTKHLICNGLVRSGQSNIGNMKDIVEKLANIFSNDIFICTLKFETGLSNIHFTDDIFNMENDINEIAYLSTKCKTIVGKNSGPFMFSHVKENINDEDKAFVSLSHRYGDCYPCDVFGIKSKYYHCSSDDEGLAFNAIKIAITDNNNLNRPIVLG